MRKYVMLAILLTSPVAASADCPDKVVICNDAYGAKVGTCFNWLAAGCQLCRPEEPANVCASHKGVKCITSNLTSLQDLTTFWAGIIGGTAQCE
jgi:hypothetical protein